MRDPRFRLLALGAILALMAPLFAPAPAADAWPEESHCGTETGDTSVSGFVSHDELRRHLERIEHTSQGRVDVDLVGHSNHGREIWSATVGEGDTTVLVQSEIHGNEKTGTTALLRLLDELGTDSPYAQEIREAVTFVAVPMMNPDGSELDQRVNDMTWDDVVETFPHLADAEPAWNWRPQVPGFDVNRDFNPDLDYEPVVGDFPGSSAGTGWYITPEAQTVREVYRDIEDEFGSVDVFVDLHHQGPCYSGEDMDGYTSLSISGRFIADPDEHGDWPDFDYDASRRANVAVHDALQTGDSPFSKITLYPQNINLPGTALGSFALRGSATVLFEVVGQTQSMGQKRMGMLTQGVVDGMKGILDPIADGSFDDIDPERYEDIPERTWAN